MVFCWRHTVDEGVQDGHGTGGDTSVGVDLLEDCKTKLEPTRHIGTFFPVKLTLVDVGRVGLLAGLAALLLLASGGGGSLLASLLLLSRGLAANGGLATGGGLLLSGLRGHFDCS